MKLRAFQFPSASSSAGFRVDPTKLVPGPGYVIDECQDTPPADRDVVHSLTGNFCAFSGSSSLHCSKRVLSSTRRPILGRHGRRLHNL